MKLIRGSKDPDSFFVESNYGMLLFDNGAATTQLPISEKTAALTAQGTTQSHGAFGTKQQATAVVDKLCAGELVAENISVRLDDNVGLLGSDILRNYAYTFDVSNLEVTFIEPFTDGIRCKVGARNHFYLPFRLGGQPYWACLDTGASVSLLDEALYHSLFSAENTGRTEEGTDCTGTTMVTEMAEVAGLTIGGKEFPAHNFALLDFQKYFPAEECPFVAIIGASTLSAKKFSINHKDGYLKIEDYIM